MNRSFLRGATFGLVLAISCFLMVSYLNQEKIVVVDSQKVLQGYQGFMEAQDLFESKMEELKEDFNNKRQVYQQKNKEYEILENQLSSLEKSEKQQELAKMQSALVKLGTKIEHQSEAEEQKLLEGVLNKINDFVNRYGDQKGYSIMLGANGQGNVMYVNESIDITQEVIEAINKEYLHGIQ